MGIQRTNLPRQEAGFNREKTEKSCDFESGLFPRDKKKRRRRREEKEGREKYQRDSTEEKKGQFSEGKRSGSKGKTTNYCWVKAYISRSKVAKKRGELEEGQLQKGGRAGSVQKRKKGRT